MEWLEELNRYKDCAMELWIEDRSGEELAKPQQHKLYKAEMAEPGEIRFYMNEKQYLSVPIFEGERTRLEPIEVGGCRFVSEDERALLVYRVHLKSF